MEASTNQTRSASRAAAVARAEAMERAGTIQLPATAEPIPVAPQRLSRSGAAWRLLRNLAARRPANTVTELRITRLCSQRCRQCAIPWGAPPEATMSLGEFREIAARLRDYGALVGFISGGEPSLHPDLPAMLDEALRTFPLACTVNTNLDNHEDLILERIGAAVRRGVNVQTSIDGLDELGDDLRGGRGVAARVLRHMELLSEIKVRTSSPSVLYVNTVLNQQNLAQIPRILDEVARRGWRSSIGSYHNLTTHTRRDEALPLQGDQELQTLIEELLSRPNITTLPAMLRGIPAHAAGAMPKQCAYLDAPGLASRLLIRENGDLYLCKGRPIGNLLQQPMAEILGGPAYRERLQDYESCPGCWNNCYTQKLLLVKPPGLRVALENTWWSLGLGRARRSRR